MFVIMTILWLYSLYENMLCSLLNNVRVQQQLIKLMPKSHSFTFHVINIFRELEGILTHGALIEKLTRKRKEGQKLVFST